MQRRRTRWGPALGALTFVAAACGGDTDDAERISAELVEETGGALDETQAGCVADGLVASFGDESFREVLDAAEGSGASAEDVRVEVIDIFAACEALDAVVLDGDREAPPG